MCSLVIVSHRWSSTRQLHRDLNNCQWVLDTWRMHHCGLPPRYSFPIKLFPQTTPVCAITNSSNDLANSSSQDQSSQYRILLSSLPTEFLVRVCRSQGCRAFFFRQFQTQTCVCVCFSLGDGDSVVCAVRDTPEPVSLQGGRTDARSGSVPDHGYCRVASGRSDLVLQAPEGTPYHAPPHSRRVPSCRQCHPLLNWWGNQSGHESSYLSAALPMLGDSGIDTTGDRERDEQLQVLQMFGVSSSTRARRRSMTVHGCRFHVWFE